MTRRLTQCVRIERGAMRAITAKLGTLKADELDMRLSEYIRECVRHCLAAGTLADMTWLAKEGRGPAKVPQCLRMDQSLRLAVSREVERIKGQGGLVNYSRFIRECIRYCLATGSPHDRQLDLPTAERAGLNQPSEA